MNHKPHIKGLLMELRALVASKGGTIERGATAYEVVAPDGKRWASGPHTLCLPYRAEWPAEWKISNLEDGIYRLRHEQLEECPDPQCDCREAL